MRKFSLVLLLSVTLPVHAAWYENWSSRPAWPEPISLATGSALTLTTLAFRKPLIDDLQEDQSRRRPLGKWSEVGDYWGLMIPNAVYAGGMITATYFGVQDAAGPAQLMITASAEAALITTALKLVVRQKRPDSNQRTSFPSGHATTAFVFAAVVGAEHGWRWGVPAYLMAGFTGWSRINDNKHYLHDVLAGATIGLSTGLGVYLERERRLGRNSADVRVFPLFLDDGGGLVAKASW